MGSTFFRGSSAVVADYGAGGQTARQADRQTVAERSKAKCDPSRLPRKERSPRQSSHSLSFTQSDLPC